MQSSASKSILFEAQLEGANLDQSSQARGGDIISRLASMPSCVPLSFVYMMMRHEWGYQYFYYEALKKAIVSGINGWLTSYPGLFQVMFSSNKLIKQ